ncbi:YwqJ-related putative deaminase [Streptomyces triculaminicus]|uniref:YwqJ-related putative deaminase n=1 Tax=Streptomyces triculaminicus TaxID=2816232 RepID=UPI0037D682F9
MLDPSEIPQFTGNLVELDKDATALKNGAGHIRDGGADIHAKFQGLSAPYHAPEAEKLFATTLPVRDKAKDFGDDLEKVAAALTAYAGEVKPLAEKLKSLKAEAERFVESVKGDKDWEYDKKKTDHQKRIRNDIDETVAAFYEAELTAANKITALVKDGTKWRVDDGSHQKGMYGFKAEDLKHAKVPWGQPEDQKHHWYEVGHWVKSFVWDGLIIDGVVGTVKGLGTLVGFDGWDAMKNAWKGLGMLAVGVAAYSIPSVRMIPDSMLPQFVKDSKKVAREAGKAMVAWDEWGKNPARAAGAVTFNVLTTITGAGNVAKAGTAAKVAGVAGKVGRVIDPMTYVSKGLGAGFQGVKVAVPKVGELMSGLRTSLGGTHAIPASFTMPGDMPSGAVPDTHGVTAASYHPTAEGTGAVPASFHGSADVPGTAPSAPHTESPASYGGAADAAPAPASHGSAPAPAPHSPAPDAPASSPSSHSSAADAPANTPTPHHEAPKAHDTPPTVMPDNSVRFWDGTTLHENGTMETPVGKPHQDPIPVELSAADRAAHQKLEASFPEGDGPGVPHGGHPSDRPAGDGASVPHEDKPVLASVGASRATADAAAHAGHVGENAHIKLDSDLRTPHEQPAHANAGGTPAEAAGRTADNTPRASHEPPTGSGTGGGHTPTHTSGGGGGHDLPATGRGGDAHTPARGDGHGTPAHPGHDTPASGERGHNTEGHGRPDGSEQAPHGHEEPRHADDAPPRDGGRSDDHDTAAGNAHDGDGAHGHDAGAPSTHVDSVGGHEAESASTHGNDSDVPHESGSVPRGVELDPQPDWHGKSAGKMRHYRFPAESVEHLSPAEQAVVLEQRTIELADEARLEPPKEELTKAEKDARAKQPQPDPGQNKVLEACAGSLLHDNVITSHTSMTKMHGQKLPETHPVLKDLLDRIEADSKAELIPPKGSGHGKCAEIALINDRIKMLEANGVKIQSLDDARRALEGAKIHTRKIGDFYRHGELVHPHGDYLPPCGTCTHILPELGIDPV